MRKIYFLTSLFLMTFIGGFAQWQVSTEVQNKNVLIEEFTGIHCGYCPYAHKIVADLLNVHDNVYAIAFHAGNYAIPGSDEPDFRLSESKEINDYFGISGYPAGMVNRVRPDGDRIVLNRTSWATYAHLYSEETAPVNLWMAASYDEASRKLTIDVQGYYTEDVDAESNYLTVVVNENNIMGPQSGGGVGDEYMHQHMVRLFATPTWGDVISNCKKGEYFSKQYIVDVPEQVKEVTLNPAEFEVIAYVTENKENVLNVTGCRPDYPGLELPLEADIAEDLIPIGDVYGYDYFDVRVTNKSTEEITNAQFTVTFNNEDYVIDVPCNVAPRTTSVVRIPFAVNELSQATKNRYVIKLTGLNGSEYSGGKLAGRFDAPFVATPTVRLEFVSDAYADENHCYIKDMDGNIVYEKGSFEPGEVLVIGENIDLQPNTRYCLEVVDEWTNGVMDGSIALYNAYGTLVCKENVIERHGVRTFFTTTAYNVSTQVQNKNILIEDFTGIYCGNCPDAHVVINEMMKVQGDKIYPIAIHAGYYAAAGLGDPDFRTPEGDSLDIYFQPDGYPNGMINRTNFDGGESYMYSRGLWNQYCHIIADQVAPVNLWLSSYYDSTTKQLTVRVEGYYTADSEVAQNMLNVVLTQSNIVGYQNGGGMGDKYIHNHVARKYLTPMWGDTIATCKQGSFFSKEYVYDVPSDINDIPFDPAHIEVVAYICEGEANVLNVAGCRPEYPDLVLPLDVELLPYRIPVNGTYAYNYYEAYLVNNSTENITTASFVITLNDVAYDVYWEGMAPARETSYIKIPFNQFDLIESANDFEVRLVQVNGVELDGGYFWGDFQDPINTTATNNFIIKTDNYADENHYLIKDMSGKVVHEFGPYPAGVVTEVTETLELKKNTVYCLEITDDWANGIMNPRGTCKIYNVDGKLVSQQLEIKNHGCRVFFATTEESGIESVTADNAYKVHYNAASRSIYVIPTEGAPYQVAIYDTAGRCVYAGENSQISTVRMDAPGVYVVKVTSANVCQVTKVAVN